MTITAIGLDADDTLWHSESHFAVTEERFFALVSPWLSGEEAAARLLETERNNLATFGYGVKGFTLSMIETAVSASDGTIPSSAVAKIVEWGKEMLGHPVELLDGVSDVIDQLSGDHRLLLITKGDLFHQESKIAESGLAERFDQVEILSEKSPDHYRQVLERSGVSPAEFLMVGNSVRSDVLPVVEIGGQAVHIPYGITWGHETVDRETVQKCWHHLDRISELPDLIRTLG
ncbi:MAG: HAD family hydrolase [Actinomycetota bacterium]